MATAMEKATDDNISKADRDSLFEAIEAGDYMYAEEVLDKVPDIASTLSDTFFSFYLHHACMYNQQRICEKLLQYGADVNQTDDQGDTPLHVALSTEADVEVIQLLLSRGANVTIPNRQGQTPFHFACMSGSFEYIDIASKHATAPLSDKDIYGCNGLHHAISNCREFDTETLKASIKRILESGVDINEQDAVGSTVLHHAASCFEVDLISHLLYQGADPFLCDCYGNSFMVLLQDTLSPDELSMLVTTVVEKLENNTCWSSVLDDSETPKGRPPELFLNLQNLSGKCLLHLFMSQAQLSTVRYLISKGADVNIQDSTGQSPLHICSRIENEHEKLSLLLHHGAKVDQRDAHGRTPLYEAADYKTVEILLANGADPNIEDKLGTTPLHVAALDHRPEVVKTLLDNGALINSQDKYGSTPLHYASWWSFESVIKVLRRCGADPAVEDNNGYTAERIQATFQESRSYRIETLNKQEVSKARASEESDTNPTPKIDVGIYNKMSVMEFASKVLSVPRLGLLSNVGEIVHVKQVVVEMLNKMMRYVSSIDARFEGRLFPTGSSTEGTRVGEPNEFDFLYFLDNLGEECDISEIYYYLMEGFVQLKAKHNQSVYSQFFGSSGILDGEMVRNKLKNLLKIAINQKEMWDTNEMFFLDFTDDCFKPVLNLEVRYIGSYFKSLEISIDIVPAIYKKAWWPSVVAPETFRLMTEDIKNAGCAVLFQNPGIKFMTDDSVENFMRISCAPAEIALFKLLPAYAKKSYALTKVLLSSDVCPPAYSIAFDGKMHDFSAGDFITSYMVKNCLLNELSQMEDNILSSLLSGKLSISENEMALAKESAKTAFSCEKPTVDFECLYESNNADIHETVSLTKKILLRLQDCVENGNLPAYFMPVNVLGYEYRAVYGEDPDNTEKSVKEKESQRKQIVSNLLEFLVSRK